MRAINTETMDVLFTEQLDELKNAGYILEFRREATCLFCLDLQTWVMPADFEVDETYFFEDLSNPDASRMLYAISMAQEVKGFLVDFCNVYTDNISPDLFHKLGLNKAKTVA